MRLPALIIVAWSLLPTILLAGLFDPDKPALELEGSKGMDQESFRLMIADVRSQGTAQPETPSRKKALTEKESLNQKSPRSPADEVRLAILNLHLREYTDAFAGLQSVRNFWALTALGTYHMHTGDAAEAFRIFQTARDLSPGQPTLTEFAMQVCEMEFKLARLRMQEALKRGGKRGGGPPDDIDQLFDLRWVGESGQYEAGQLAATERAKLPANAVAIVQQLLLWHPDDARLYWLLGELYAAQGDLDAALEVFNECMDSRRYDTPLLRQHRLAVKTAIAERPPAWMPVGSRLWAVAAMGSIAAITLASLQLRQILRLRKRK